MCRTRSAWQRWLWDILEGERSGAAPDERRPLHAAEDGMLVFVSLLTIVFFLALVALLGNVGRTVNQKIEVQNTADAVAQSGALWIARGLNSITATNHLTGELMSFVILLDAIGVRGNSTVDQPTQDQAQALNDAVQLAKSSKVFTGTYAYDKYVDPNADPLGNGGARVRTYKPDDAKNGAPPSTVTQGKKNLLKAFISIYTTKAVAGALEQTKPFPPTVIAGYVLDFIALAVELYALAEWFVLDVVETVAQPLLNGEGNIRDAIFGASPGDGLLAASVRYTRRIHDTVGTQNQLPGLVDRSAAAIGALNRCDAAVLWGPQDLPIAPESFDTNASDTQFARSQLVRATWPWVVYHRRPILHMTAWMRLSRTPILYQQYTTAYALTTCRQFYTTHQLYLYVIDDPGNPGADKDKGKGHESWATDSDRAAYLFGVLGFAHRSLPTPFGSRVFGQANPNGVTTCAQAFVYNANRQEPDNHKPNAQPMVGWDTLNWSAPVDNANAYEQPNDPGGVKNLYNDKTAAPRVYLNWQATLVPVSSKALANVLPRLPDKFRSAFNPSDPLPPSFRTHCGCHMLNRSRQSPTPRRGLAPLEFVLVLPLLVAATLLIYTIAQVVLVKGNAIIDARNQAWLATTAPAQRPLFTWGPIPNPKAAVSNSPDAGAPAVTSSKPFAPPYGSVALLRDFRVPKTMTASQTVLQGSWDHETISFSSNGALIPSPLLVDFVGSQVDVMQGFHDLQSLLQALVALGKTLPGSITEKEVAALLNLRNDINTVFTDIQSIQTKLLQIMQAMSPSGGGSTSGGLGGGVVSKIGGAAKAVGSGNLGGAANDLAGGLKGSVGAASGVVTGVKDVVQGKSATTAAEDGLQAATGVDVPGLIKLLQKTIGDGKTTVDDLKPIAQQVMSYLQSQAETPPVDPSILNIAMLAKALADGKIVKVLNELKTLLQDGAAFPELLLDLFNDSEFSDF